MDFYQKTSLVQILKILIFVSFKNVWNLEFKKEQLIQFEIKLF